MVAVILLAGLGVFLSLAPVRRAFPLESLVAAAGVAAVMAGLLAIGQAG